MRIADCGLRIGQWGSRAACLGLLAALSGCGKELVITQDSYINTGVGPNGEPMELNVVYVYPKDLDHPANSRLAPDRGITSDVWFRDRPQGADAKDTPDRGARFWIPREQILLLNNPPADTSYGVRIGNRPRGASYDAKEEVGRWKLDFKGSAGSKESVIYVFGRFSDANGNPLPRPPARFNPPGDYGKELRVHIGGQDLKVLSSK